MSYLHCPSCKRAYNIAVQATCPFCPVHATMVDATEDIVAAAEQLARAMARATPSERGNAAARIDRLALPDPGAPEMVAASGSGPARVLLRQLRDVLEPAPVAPPTKPALLVTLAMALDRRLTAIESRWRPPKLLGDGLRRVRARVKALAQA